MNDTIEQIREALDTIDYRLERDTSVDAVKDKIEELYATSKKLKFKEGIARCERHYADLYDQAGEFEEAAKFNNRAKRFAKKEGLEKLYFGCVFFELVVMLRADNLKRCFVEASKLLKLAEQCSDSFTMALIESHLGIVAIQHSFDDEAISRFRKSLSISEQFGYMRVKANILIHLAEIFLLRSQFNYAEKYARESIAVYYKLQDAYGQIRSKNRLATILIEKNELSEVKNILDSLWRLQKDLNGPTLGSYYVCKGKFFSKKHEYFDAITEFEKAIDVFKLFKRDRLLANTYAVMAEMYYEGNKIKEAVESAQKHLQIVEQMSDLSQATIGYRLLYLCYKLAGDKINAFDYLEKYNERVRIEEEQLLKTRIEYIELQKEYEMVQIKSIAAQENSESLRIELEHKERELTEKTRHLIKQTDALAQFRDDLRAIIRRSPSTDPLAIQIKERLKNVPKDQMNWGEFDKQFHSIHPVFLAKLGQKHPNLTPMERKICILLRVNMTSLDIAKLLNLSDRSIENHRYRIRKKVMLNSERSLHEYLSKI